MEIVNNDFTIEIEGEIYHIKESYIVNGTGYTFAIYDSVSNNFARIDYYLVNHHFNEIVIVSKKYNYLLIKDKNKFEFDVIKYDKNILRCYNDNDAFIYLNGKKLMHAHRDIELFEKEMLICKQLDRKEKLIKINE